MHEPSSEGKAGEAGRPSPWVCHYTLSLLTIVYALNYLDRNVFSIVLQSIKQELLLSDTALGLLGGLVFAAFYATLGIPIAWLADRYSRRNIITIGLSVWSLMTVLTGMVTSLWQLAATRFLMGAGEACGNPPANSMVADLYEKEKRGTAISILVSGSTIGVFLGYLMGGWLNEFYGWRTVYFIAGVPGLIVALLFWMTVREPGRGATDRDSSALSAGSFRETLLFFLQSKTYLFVVIGSCMMAVHIMGNAIWYPAFMERVHGLRSGEIGTYLAISRGPVGIVGIFLGGWLADRLGRRDERWRVWVPALGCLLVVPGELLFLFSDTLWLSVSGMIVAGFFVAVHTGPIYAIVLTVARVRMRATATALFLFCGNMVGQTLGPLGIGYVNDLLTPSLQDHAIRYSLLLGPASALLGFIVIWMGSRYVVQDIQNAAG
jgi:MFS family permease